ncbi:unnamed protein product, partial [Polarella glacialis]
MLILTEPVGSVAELKDAVLDLRPHLDVYSMAIYDSQGDLADEADIVSMMETYSVEDQPAVPPSMGHVEANPENIDIEDQPAAVHDKALGDVHLLVKAPFSILLWPSWCVCCCAPLTMPSRTSYDAEPEMLILTEPVGSVAELKDAVLDLHPHLDFYSMAIYDSQGDLADEADIVSMMETYSVEDQPAVPPSMGHVEANPENIDIEDQPAAVHDKALGD